MTYPTIYTEATLTTYIQAVLKGVAAETAFTATHYAEVVNDTLLAYGVSDIADATDIRKIRTLARREALRAALESAEGTYAFPGTGTVPVSNKNDNRFASLVTAYSMACADALPYDLNYQATLSTADYTQDPYMPGFGEV